MKSRFIQVAALALLQVVLFGFFFERSRRLSETGRPLAGKSQATAIPAKVLDMKPKALGRGPETSAKRALPPPLSKAAFEERLDELLRLGEFEEALRFVYSQPDRIVATNAFGAQLAKHLDKPEALRSLLLGLPQQDRQPICRSLLQSAEHPFELLKSMREAFPRGRHLNWMLQAHIQWASPEHMEQAIEFINTMPDSPLRQNLIFEALVKRGFEDVDKVKEALDLLPNSQVRARYVEIVRGSKHFRELDEGAQEPYARVLEAYGEAPAARETHPAE